MTDAPLDLDALELRAKADAFVAPVEVLALVAALRAARRERDALRPYAPECSCGSGAALRTGGEK